MTLLDMRGVMKRKVTCTQGISMDGSLAMQRDLARNGGAVKGKGSHDDSPHMPSEDIVVDGQGEKRANQERGNRSR